MRAWLVKGDDFALAEFNHVVNGNEMVRPAGVASVLVRWHWIVHR